MLLLRAATGEEIVASVIGAVPPPGSQVWLTADAGHALLFDAATGARVEAPVALRERAA